MCPHCLSDKVRGNTCADCGRNVHNVPKDPRALRPGAVLRNQFVIGKQLGAGGFGITYLAYDRMLKQKIAIKEFMPKKVAAREANGNKIVPVSENHLGAFAKGKEQFIEEARTIAQFRHENIVPILTCFEANDTAYFVMPYVRGRTLAEIALKGGGVPEPDLLKIIDAVLKGLEAVHGKGVWHRDIKPANIYIPDARDEQPFLLDFGAARQAVHSSDPLSILLTHGYAPLEQYSSTGSQGAYTDLYAVAATMYSCLRGEVRDGRLLPPPPAEDRVEADILEDIGRVAKGKIKKSTATAIMRAMEMSVAARPASVREFRALLYDQKTPPPPPPPPMHYELVCLAGQYEGERIPLDENQMIMGRSMADVSLWVEAKTVSKQHCSIMVEDGKVILADGGSLNGTFVNERRLDKGSFAVLRPGDVFNLAGSLVFQLQEVAGARGEAAPWVEPVGHSTISPTSEVVTPVPGVSSHFLERLIKAQGRLNRAKYCVLILASSAGTYFFSHILEQTRVDGIGFMALILFIISFAVAVSSVVRRFHDLGRSGYHYFLMLIPLVNLYWGCVLLFKKGEEGPNRYGPDPINMKFSEV
ncbi:hypothetical protein AWY79_07225 [Pseudodesulfovibrio indicus]|nr:hypothetical protein AWY79_07225 [Pseudodesulfovibrio indicus]